MTQLYLMASFRTETDRQMGKISSLHYLREQKPWHLTAQGGDTFLYIRWGKDWILITNHTASKMESPIVNSNSRLDNNMHWSQKFTELLLYTKDAGQTCTCIPTELWMNVPVDVRNLLANTWENHIKNSLLSPLYQHRTCQQIQPKPESNSPSCLLFSPVHSQQLLSCWDEKLDVPSSLWHHW